MRPDLRTLLLRGPVVLEGLRGGSSAQLGNPVPNSQASNPSGVNGAAHPSPPFHGRRVSKKCRPRARSALIRLAG